MLDELKRVEDDPASLRHGSRSLAAGALALGAATVGGLVLGGLFLGGVLVGRLYVRRGRFETLSVGDLVVERLTIVRQDEGC